MKKERVFCQTFATDLIDRLSDEKRKEMLALHYLSALSIKQQLSDNDIFYLITDTRGKKYTENFPYDVIVTSLDDYPYVRPLKMSSYKLYAIELFKGKTFIHFDNDVILFKRIPIFKDTIVQSNESNFIETVYINKVQYFKWEFPEYVKDFKCNYNPGIFGFEAKSKIRDEYYNTFLKYSHKNINLVNKMELIDKELHVREMQDIYLFLEEGLLWYLCNKKDIDVVEFIPDKYKNHKNVWGVYSKGKYRGTNWNIPFKVCYMNWRKDQYVHLMNYDHIKLNWETSFLPQEVFLELYYKNKKNITEFLKR